VLRDLAYRVEEDAEQLGYLDVTYARVTGFRPLLLDLFVPRSTTPAAVVLYIHGGGFRVGNHRDWPAFVPALTARGFAVACPQYRLSGEASFPAPLHDLKAAVRWLREHAEDAGIDPRRIGAWGCSAGGYFVAMLASTAGRAEFDGTVGIAGPDSGIQAGVSWYGPMNLATQPRLGPAVLHITDPAQSPESLLLGAAVETVPDLAAAASPVTHVSADSAPMLLVHGTEDDGVPIAQSEELLAASASAGASAELIRVSGGGHGFTTVDQGPLIGASCDFLAYHLVD
jgi:acetyl esterase/lipase